MMASPAAMGAGFMEARTIEAAAAGEAANGKLDGQMHSLAHSISGHQRLFRGSMTSSHFNNPSLLAGQHLSSLNSLCSLW